MQRNTDIEDAAKWLALADGDRIVILTSLLVKLTDVMAYSQNPKQVMGLRSQIERLTHIRDQLAKATKEKIDERVRHQSSC